MSCTCLLGIPAEDWAQTPESVRLVVRSLVDIVESLRAELRTVTTQVQELQAQVGQTSRNSSKPPSSDPPSAPPTLPRTPRGRKAGGQVGHDGHQRPLVPPDQVDIPIDLRPDSCPHCHTDLAPSLPDASPLRRTQVWELPPIIPIITEYRQHTLCCPQCRELVTADLPPDAPPGAFGPGVTALIGLMRGHYRFSLDAAEEFLAEVCNLPLRSGSIVTSCERVSDALAPVDAAIQEAVLAHPQVNADETSWPTETRKGWLWVAVCAITTCFRIHPSRGKAGLRAVLGEAYRGIVGSDRLGTYKQFAPGQRQLCWAHLLRNLLGLLTRYADDQRWAQRMLALTDDLFFAWHAYKEGWYDQIALQQALIPVRLAMHELLRESLILSKTGTDAKLLSPRTIEYIRAILRQALNQALRWGSVPRNVAILVDGPRVEKFKITPLSIQQIQQFLSAAAGHRFEPLYRLTLSLGLRIGEVLGLGWEHIDFAQATIQISGALQELGGRSSLVETKTKSGVRTLAMSPALSLALHAHQQAQARERADVGDAWQEHDLVFPSSVGTPMSARNLQRHFKTVLAAAGLPATIRFHDLRHSCATLLIAQGVHQRVVMEILGHSQISLTMNTYAHVLPETQREAAVKLDVLLARPQKEGTPEG